MWSYPIIRDGLIYVIVIDIRNGLYILRYTGSHAGGLSPSVLSAGETVTLPPV